MKKLLIILTALFCFAGAKAETVSQKQAQQLAQLFFNEATGRVTAPPKLIYNGRRLTTNRLFTPFYVYNSPLGGFVIISAENKAYPILGFSLKENFDPETLGETETALLKSYALEIEFVRYDSEPIEETVKAWQEYDSYVFNLLHAPYIATDPDITVAETEIAIENAIEKETAIYSDIYTPEQWEDLIKDELKVRISVPMALIGDNRIYPMTVYGLQGNYFRIEMDRRNGWLMRLNATDVISANMVTTLTTYVEEEEPAEEEPAFAVHDEFLDEVASIEAKRGSEPMTDGISISEEPSIRAHGGAHYEITLPENGALALVYNISGSLLNRIKTGDTQKVNIDISAEPSGFYFVTVIGESGEPYGFKMVR